MTAALCTLVYQCKIPVLAWNTGKNTGTVIRTGTQPYWRQFTAQWLSEEIVKIFKWAFQFDHYYYCCCYYNVIIIMIIITVIIIVILRR